MLKIDSYLEENIRLINSLKIKWHVMGVHINLAYNRHSNTAGKYIPTNLKTWKYYQNLAGDYHTIDDILLGTNGMVLTSLDTDTDFKVTKTSILNHPVTKNRLMSDGDLLKYLFAKYPKQNTLIRGILDPIDINKAISAPDGSILDYDERLVEPDETNVIAALELTIKNFIARWHIDEYMIIDEYYMPGIYASLVSALLLSLLNTRLSNIGTDRAHSFHIREHFKSNRSVHDVMGVINNDVRLWLYKNLTRIVKFGGQEGILDDIVNNVIRPSGIDVMELIIKQKDVIPNLKLIDRNYKPKPDEITKPFFDKEDEILFWARKGTIDDLPDNTNVDIVVEGELAEVAYTDDMLFSGQEAMMRDIREKIRKLNITENRTKVLKLQPKSRTLINPVDRKTVIVETFLYKALMSPDTTKLHFADEQTHTEYDLTYRQAALLLLDVVTTELDVSDTKFKQLRLSNIVNHETVTDLMKNVLLPVETQTVVTKLLNERPDITAGAGTANRADDYKLYINDTLDFFDKVWRVVSNSDNEAVNASIRLVTDRLTIPVNVPLDPAGKTFKELLQESGLVYDRGTSFETKKWLKDLFHTFTGLHLFKEDELNEMMDVFKHLINNLSSYTLQVLKKDIGDGIYSPYTSPDLIHSLNLAGIIDTNFQCLEQFQAVIVAKGIDVKDRVLVINRPNLHYRVTDESLHLTARPVNEDRPYVVRDGLNVTIGNKAY